MLDKQTIRLYNMNIKLVKKTNGGKGMAKFQIDYFLKNTNPLYSGRRTEKEFKNMKDALAWASENLSDKAHRIEILEKIERKY